MKRKEFILKNASHLKGRTVAITGSTGGIGQELCRYLAAIGASLILMDRNQNRSQALKDRLIEKFPNINITLIPVELSDMDSVKTATARLKALEPYVFIHNAGAYSIPRHICSTGMDNVFQINFLSPYYIIRELLPTLRENGGRVIVMGSIAHRYSQTRKDDIDFSKERRASRVYGNAKRYLMFSLYGLFEEETNAHLAVVHPGITFTGITAHYPKLIFALIKRPMKVIFPKPAKACLSALVGTYEDCGYRQWIGPRIFDIWGYPKKKHLGGISDDEIKDIEKTADTLYLELKK